MPIILETERLILREFTLDDTPVFHRMVTDRDVTRYTGEGGRTITLDEARQGMIDRPLRDYATRGYGRWATVLKATNEVIGFAGLKYLDDVQDVDLGYRFFKEFWGRGLATEASRAVVEYGFGPLQLKKIIGIADRENVASIRVLEKLGFTWEKFTTYRDAEVAWYTKHA